MERVCGSETILVKEHDHSLLEVISCPNFMAGFFIYLFIFRLFGYLSFYRAFQFLKIVIYLVGELSSIILF